MPEEVRPAPESCRNCGSELTGPFCAECGQRADDYRRPIWLLTKEVLESFVSYDERLIRTVGDLFLRPGVVMRAWSNGRRKAYSAPLRLYLTISVIYFFSLALSGQAQISYAPPGDSRAVVPSGPTQPAATPKPVDSFVATINRGLMRAQSNPAAFNGELEVWLKRIPIVMVPVLALLLRLFYIGSGVMLIEEIVFSLYFHSGALIIFMISNGLHHVVPQFDNLLMWTVTAIAALFGVASARSFFNQSILTTVLKWIGIAAVYVTVIGFATVGVVLFVLSEYA